ncbi:MAG: hypothetical protein AB7L09_03805 [Nitrospira sp.]
MLTLTRSAVLVLVILLAGAVAHVSTAASLPRSHPPAWWSLSVTSIHAILSDPRYYQSRIVRIRGVVQSITQVSQPATCGVGGGLGVGYQIRVHDESSELTVMDLGPCGRGNRGPVLPETLAGGEQIDAIILVSYINIPGQDPNPPEGVLQWIDLAQ